jgi:hypothetical protein
MDPLFRLVRLPVCRNSQIFRAISVAPAARLRPILKRGNVVRFPDCRMKQLYGGRRSRQNRKPVAPNALSVN